MSNDPDPTSSPIYRRRQRYPGKYPRQFHQKYKELNPAKYTETTAKVLAGGKTPAGTHRPVMVREILETLAPRPGEVAIDCTLGYGGHAAELLRKIVPGGRLFGLDADPLELPKTEKRIRELGFGPETFVARRSNFAGLLKVLALEGIAGADVVLADLGVSSMQLDDPGRGFTFKQDGPLDMRMNPQRGVPASVLLGRVRAPELQNLLLENDEPHAGVLAGVLAGRHFETTRELASAIRLALGQAAPGVAELSIRRVFQALRIAVNDEFSALENLLRSLPEVLNPGGRVAILSFHSGEDRRVKSAFLADWRAGRYASISTSVIRPSAEECYSNPRSVPAKLRWALKALEATNSAK